MDFQHKKVSQTLQMKAKRALTDISNQEDFRTKEWLTKSRVKARRKSYDQSSTKLPQIAYVKQSFKQPTNDEIFLIRKRNQFHKERISQILDRTQRLKLLPHYNINNKFAQQMNEIKRSKISLRELKCSKYKENTFPRFQTQNSQEKESQEQQIISFIKSRGTTSQKQIKSSWSQHVKKSLTGMGRVNQNISKEIQEIKQLIYDKRIKCRKLSKQGYLIVKRQNLQNFCEQDPPCIQSLQLKQKPIQKVGNRYEPFSKILTDRGNEQQFLSKKQNSLSKNFLRNALGILHMKHNSNVLNQKSGLKISSELKIQH